jgi:hypothetical protein
MAEACPLPSLVERLCAVAERPALDADTRAFFVSALLKLSAQVKGAHASLVALVRTSLTPPSFLRRLGMAHVSRRGLARRAPRRSSSSSAAPWT